MADFMNNEVVNNELGLWAQGLKTVASSHVDTGYEVA